jgi:CHAD domain-containing protein
LRFTPNSLTHLRAAVPPGTKLSENQRTMPYAFEQGEPLPSAVARIMDEQIIRAREQLTDASVPIATRVHDARKRFKETRALLRLIRDPLGATFAIENAWYRDAARDLAASRDSEAVLEAFGKLDLPRGVATRVRKTLLSRQEAQPPLEPILENAVEQLVVAQARVALWPRLDDSFTTIADGLLRTYRLGRRASKRARQPDELHEWRKRVKEHWYHLQLLRELWPPVFKSYAAALQELSRTLGDHHDLHVLRGLITAPTVIAAIDARSTQLEAEARAMGARVYAESPRAWRARIRNLWKAWTA